MLELFRECLPLYSRSPQWDNADYKRAVKIKAMYTILRGLFNFLLVFQKYEFCCLRARTLGEVSRLNASCGCPHVLTDRHSLFEAFLKRRMNSMLHMYLLNR